MRGLRARVEGAPVAPVAAVAAAVGVLGIWNASRYPANLSYDGTGNLAYADGILHGRLPAHTGEFHLPPGFYALAAVVDRAAAAVTGLGDPHRAMQAVNVALLVLTVVLVWRIVLALWPERPTAALLAALFVALLPVTERAAAMFHPETLDLFLTTLGIWLSVRLLRRRDAMRLACAVGAVLGAAQLVRAFALAVLAAVLLTLLVHRRTKEAAAVLAVALVVPLGWYVRQWVVYGTPVPFNRPAPRTAIWNRRPLDFYVGTGLPAVLSAPYRLHFANQAVPTTYSELWGDYFGHWAWNGRYAINAGTRRELRLQALVGVLPTLLAVGGWLALLATARRRPAQLLLALVPLIGLLEYLAFTVTYPSRDGDVLKATYLLATTSGWAAGFAFAVTRMPRRALLVCATLLVAAAVVDVPFLVYR